VRQECPLSPLLFTVHVADIDEMLKKGQAAESAVDLVMMAKSEREMKEMMWKKKLVENVEKANMMVFNERKKKSKENKWKWEGRKVERVNER
jgi:hypothetical protein